VATMVLADRQNGARHSMLASRITMIYCMAGNETHEVFSDLGKLYVILGMWLAKSA